MVLARPGVVGAAPALARSSGLGLPPASPDRCDGPAARSLTPPDPTAPRGAPPRPPSAPAPPRAPTRGSRHRAPHATPCGRPPRSSSSRHRPSLAPPFIDSLERADDLERHGGRNHIRFVRPAPTPTLGT